MPVETPRLPKETHQYLLQGSRYANNHMPIVGYEVAQYEKENIKMGDVIRAIIPSLVGAAFFFLLAGVFALGWIAASQ